jgi:hypothetical protein
MDGDFPGLEIFLDFFSQILANTGNRSQIGPGKGSYISGQALNVQGCPAVGPDPENIFPLKLQEAGHFVKYFTDLLVVDGYWFIEKIGAKED